MKLAKTIMQMLEVLDNPQPEPKPEDIYLIENAPKAIIDDSWNYRLPADYLDEPRREDPYLA